ncbi:MAG: hypothetical protein HXS48_15005 [Theionarchaea archaeon]|nr:MAG: hypothetical protein AYK19_01080 [Theionarchaea archaeon DG-70-1]MBU7028240.1 hypothetical protein [Theionarchaea archaeon]
MIEGRKTDNLLMRIWLETIQNIVGSNGTKAILNHAQLQKYIDNFPPDNDEMEIPLEDVKNLRHSLIDLFGGKGAWGLQLRVGQRITRIFIEKRPGIAKATRIATGLLSEPKRMRLALEHYKEQGERRTSSLLDAPRYDVQEEEDYFLFIDRDNYMSEGTTSQTPVCGVTVGSFQSMMEWITGHKHKVEEIECRAMGYPADVFRIWKSKEE